jgi:hypothetical protein
MDVSGRIGPAVDGHQFQLRHADHQPGQAAADAAEAVNSYPYRHSFSSWSENFTAVSSWLMPMLAWGEDYRLILIRVTGSVNHFVPGENIKIAPRKLPCKWFGDLFAITLKAEEALLQFFERLEAVRYQG